jgi:P27 family predicted phage terminase small subunit
VGRPRKSEELHELEGTTPHYDAESIQPGSRPRCPKELTPEERKIFRETVRELEKRRVLTSGDAEIIRLLAVKISQHKRAIGHVRSEGEIVSVTRISKSGLPYEVNVKNMWLGIAQEAEGKITALLDRLGLTPLNRGRVRKTKSEEPNGLSFH